jgi:hypothetical protein
MRPDRQETRSFLGPLSDPEISRASPKLQEKPFDLLRRAYVEARYNPRYRIARGQLEYLAQRVRKLQRLTKKTCQARIESYLSP